VIGPAAGVVVPIRAFAAGKGRLAPELDEPARAELARRMADRVVDAAAGFPVVVVSSAPEVGKWAEARGLHLLDDAGGLDAAAAAGVAWCATSSLPRAVIAHADLPLAASLAPLARDAGQPIVALVPCHRDDGTTVISVPVESGFRFGYGPGSFRRHGAEARRLGFGLRVVRDPALSFDVDVPADLERLRASSAPARP
jgi:2-phospho-L-lactate/phosphoenolpyruvate guanylyltransferase